MRPVAAAFLVALVALASFSSGRASAIQNCGSSGICWFETASPTYVQLGAYSAFKVPYANVENTPSVGIVFMVVRNSTYQTVEISTSTLQLGGGANGTAYTIAFGLEPGTYSATFFAYDTSAGQISNSETASFTQ
jgi:hypothetical protein